MDGIKVTVNGEPRDCGVGPHSRLLEWLRAERLTGAKEGCAEGECGACAVLVARPDGETGSRWTAVNSCLPPALAFDGQEIITSEGFGVTGVGKQEMLHPVQHEMASRGGSQCGFCTPGFICSMAAEYYRPGRSADRPSEGVTGTADGQVRPGDHDCGPNGFDLQALSGNLCRCTGYRPIRDAAYALATPSPEDPIRQRQDAPAPPAPATEVRDGSARFVRPSTLKELYELLSTETGARLVAGATDLGVEVNLRHLRPALTIAIDRLDALRVLSEDPGGITIGAALTLSEIERGLGGRVPLLGQLFPQFASRLIRNAASLGGNLATGSPVGDSAPALLALDAAVILASASGERKVPLSGYFTGYRQSVREPSEVLRAIHIPLPLPGHTAFFKIAKRRFDDIATVSVAIAMDIDRGAVAGVRIGLGGVAGTPIRAYKTEEALNGKPWDLETVSSAAEVLRTEGTPIDDFRASAGYRSAMLEQALHRFYAEKPGPMTEAAR